MNATIKLIDKYQKKIDERENEINTLTGLNGLPKPIPEKYGEFDFVIIAKLSSEQAIYKEMINDLKTIYKGK